MFEGKGVIWLIEGYVPDIPDCILFNFAVAVYISVYCWICNVEVVGGGDVPGELVLHTPQSAPNMVT